MHFLASFLLALPALAAALPAVDVVEQTFGAAPAQTYEPTWAHFATESANKEAPYYDLTRFGIKHGVLPKTYDFANGTGITYNAEASYSLFKEVLEGKHDRRKIPDQSSTSAALAERDEEACGGIDLKLNGSCAGFSYSNQCVNPNTCVNQGGCQWSSVNVFSVSSVYITFWASSACNGAKGSFNPHCNQGSEQDCQFNVQWKSFRLYGGCHDGDQSNC